MLVAGSSSEDITANSEYADLSKVSTFPRIIVHKRQSVAPGRTLRLDVINMPLQPLKWHPPHSGKVPLWVYDK